MSEYGPSDLTISVSTLERRELVVAAIDSMIPHTPRGVTLMVTLNGSSDEVGEAVQPCLERWNGPARLRRLSETVPFAEGHNTIIGEVETRLVNFMGDDDLMLGPRFEKVFALFDRHPDLAAVGCYATRMGGPSHAPKLRGRAELGPTTIEQWREYRDEPRPYTMVFPTIVFSVDALREVGGFDHRFEAATDYRLVAELTQRRPMLVLPERDVFAFRVHMGSESAKAFDRQFLLGKWADYCVSRTRAGHPEPTFEDYLAADRERPPLARLNSYLRRRSLRHFRFAGARMLGGQPARGAVDLVAAALWSPALFMSKVRDQFGNRSPTE